MKNIMIKYALGLVAALGMTACTLHEEPVLTENGELGVDPTQVVVNLDLSMNLELPGTDVTLFPVGEGYVRRFIVEAYDEDRILCKRIQVIEDDITATSIVLPVSMRLHARKYRLIVWSDYVSAEPPEEGVIYNAESLVPVINIGSYRGNSNLKDAFTGYVDLDLADYADNFNAKVSSDITLYRPLGRYELIATDLAAFKSRLEQGTINGKSFQARIKYAGSLAVGFNCYDQVRKHSLVFMQYVTSLRIPNDDSANLSLGFDYCMVTPDEMLNVPVEIEIINENKETLSRTLINLPVAGGKNTIVSGRFMTSAANGGLNVDADFDGDINVDLGELTPER